MWINDGCVIDHSLDALREGWKVGEHEMTDPGRIVDLEAAIGVTERLPCTLQARAAT
jgi:hypothetical protein